MFVFAFAVAASAATWTLVDGKIEYESGKTYEIAFNPGVHVFTGLWTSSDKTSLTTSGDGTVTVVSNTYNFGIASYDFSKQPGTTNARGKVISIDPQGKTGTIQVTVTTSNDVTPSATVTFNFVSRKSNDSSSGCTAAYAPFALLLAAPLFFFRKKK